MPGFDEWESFYVIVGAAAGALIGLQFVVMTLLADKPQPRVARSGRRVRHAERRAFQRGAASLGADARALARHRGRGDRAGAWSASPGSSIWSSSFAACARQHTYRPDREDWTYHVCCRSSLTRCCSLSAFVATSHRRRAEMAVAAATLLQLFIGMHNSWDTIVYHVLVRMRDAGD